MCVVGEGGKGSLCPFAHQPAPNRIESVYNSEARPENVMPFPPVTRMHAPQVPSLHGAVYVPWVILL